jgi:hypothetical protein
VVQYKIWLNLDGHQQLLMAAAKDMLIEIYIARKYHFTYQKKLAKKIEDKVKEQMLDSKTIFIKAVDIINAKGRENYYIFCRR